MLSCYPKSALFEPCHNSYTQKLANALRFPYTATGYLGRKPTRCPAVLPRPVGPWLRAEALFLSLFVFLLAPFLPIFAFNIPRYPELHSEDQCRRGRRPLQSVSQDEPCQLSRSRHSGRRHKMRLHVIAFSLTAGIIWGAVMLLVALANLVWPTYGHAFLQIAESIYPGYHPASGIVSVIIGTLYGLVDGAIGGAIFAWVYNLFAHRLSSQKA